MIDLTELLEEHSRDEGLPADERLSAVRRRIVRRRRRRQVAGAGVAVLAVAGGFLLPWGPGPGSAPVAATPSALPSGSSSSGPSAVRPPAPGGKVGPFAEYAHGYRVVAVGSAPVSAGEAEVSWQVGSTDVQLFTYCPGQPGTSLEGEFTLDGTPLVSTNCFGELHQDPNETPGLAEALTAGRTATVRYRVAAHGQKRGTVYFAVAERVPFAEFPLPPRPAVVRTPQPDGGGTEPGAKIVHSDATDPRKTVTTTMVWHYGYDTSFTILPSTPGIYTVAVDGVTIGRVETYDYLGGGKGWSCSVGKDGSHCYAGLPTIADGQTVRVTFTAEYATGPWLGELDSHPTPGNAHG